MRIASPENVPGAQKAVCACVCLSVHERVCVRVHLCVYSCVCTHACVCMCVCESPRQACLRG